MAKLYRGSRAPAGADLPLRNTRLYGGRDEQIAGAALASRGTPNPDRGPGGTYVPRAVLAQSREVASHAARLQRAQTAMFVAQRAVRDARSLGHDTAALVVVARERRAAYLYLTGGVERRSVDAPIAVAR
jgi:hypothetical protein